MKEAVVLMPFFYAIPAFGVYAFLSDVLEGESPRHTVARVCLVLTYGLWIAPLILYAMLWLACAGACGLLYDQFPKWPRPWIRRPPSPPVAPKGDSYLAEAQREVEALLKEVA